MTRRTGDFKAYSFYHIYNRGNNKDEVIKYADDKKLFLNILYTSLKKTDLYLFAYCIMDNHFHLIIKTGEHPQIISKFMQSFGTSFAIQVNRKNRRVGHVFQGAYRSKLLRYKKDIRQVLSYVKENPVKEGLVKRSKDYPWGKVFGLI